MKGATKKPRRRKENLLTDYRVFETRGFAEDLKKDFGGQREKIKKKLITYVYPQIKQQPFFGKNIKKLVNYSPPTWRYRIGDYRFFYTIDDHKKIVYMLAAESRANAY